MRIGTLKESYAADAALFDSADPEGGWPWAPHCWCFPFMASDYWLYLACLVSINVASSAG